LSELVRRRYPYLLAACTAIAALILALMPAERSIGAVIKIVYLHGALSRVGMAGFLLAGLTAAVYLTQRQPSASRWSWAFALTGWTFWVGHFVVSMPATRLTWGPWVAWGEPRVTTTLQLAALGLAVLVISRVLGSKRFMAGANMVLAGATIFVATSTGTLRHPLDPIGSSPSAVLRTYYLVLLASMFGAFILIAYRLTLSRHVEWLGSLATRHVQREVT
jgi:hypothetical protein